MVTIAAFYRFTRLADPQGLRGPLARLACNRKVKGTILMAPEGLNGTVAGTQAGVAAVIAHLRTLPGCEALDVKISHADENPFGRLKVRLKREIVTMGVPSVDPLAGVGRYVAPGDWNALIAAPDVVTIDTRNSYEVEIGTFQGAIDPKTDSFGDFPAWWQANRQRFEGKRVAMFCTGGIRCEKATNYLLGEGVSDVFHLDGGILRYLETIPEGASMWRGECFVFDERVSVGHGLRPGRFELCRGCRKPLSADDTGRPGYEEGVSCPRCVSATSERQKDRFRERHRQMVAAERRGKRHIGQIAKG